MSAIYLVTTPSGERLVNAPTKHAAINHVIKPGVSAKALTALELSQYTAKGLALETASEPQPETNKETSDGSA